MKEKKCIDCRWWREQRGSAHVLCPTSPDFSFSWGPTPCELFAPVKDGEKIVRDDVNAFMAWAGGDKNMPTREMAEAYLAKNPLDPGLYGQ